MNTDRFQFRVFSLDTANGYIYCPVFNELLLNSTETIQQCIGVKDKNNRLIYEGDVIAYKPDWVTDLVQAAVGVFRYCFDRFVIFHVQRGKYNSKFDGNLEYFNFYDLSHGTREFEYSELEVIGSIADKYLLNKDGEIIKELEETDKTNLLQLLKYE